MVAFAKRFGSGPRGFVHLPGYTAEYLVAGDGAPLVLVPSFGGGIDLLAPLVEQLAKTHRVYAYELRGELNPFLERSHGFQQLVTDLESFIDLMGLERPGLMGVSFGGAIALEYASRHPNRLAFLGVQGSGATFNPGLFADVARTLLERMPLPTDNTFLNQFFRVLLGMKRPAQDQFDFVVDRWWKTDQSVVSHRLAILEEFDVRGRLASIATPTLVVGCDMDVVVHSAEAKALVLALPNGQFVEIEKAGHLAFVTHPDRIGRQLANFGAHH